MLLVGSSAAADPAAGCTTRAGVTTCVFAYTGGAQSWTVPAGVTSATFDVYGAQGGTDANTRPGGTGGHAKATFAVSAGSTFELVVGGRGVSGAFGPPFASGAGGFNGGAAGGGGTKTPGGPGGGGGGGCRVRKGGGGLGGGCGLSSRV